ncbi:hypothetical protein N8013_04375 [Algibacter sp.]|nr:hypothetical protein [Algibacter sp.]MDA9069652.1 hypothetical protein [Algibacter sp.]MDB4352573.1 hypothetical protein [Porticoccaceae bacterium]MDC1226867.1 hypothetical protein [Algibacter sp.]
MVGYAKNEFCIDVILNNINPEDTLFVNQIIKSRVELATKAGKNVQPMLPQHVWEYLDEMNFYK